MRATLQKINAVGIDKDDSLQFRVEKEAFEDDGDELLQIRKGNSVIMKAEGLQGQLVDSQTGEVKATNERIEAETNSISISLAVLPDGMIATITVTVEDKLIVERILNSGLRGQLIDLRFEEK